VPADFIILSLREGLEVIFGILFARLQRGLLFFFERSLRRVIVVLHIIMLVVKKVDVLI
jgi:hypothetical protein